MTKILGVCASPFKLGNTASVLKVAMEAIEQADPSVELKMIYLPEDFPRHDGRRDEEKFSLKQRIAKLSTQGDLRKTVRAIMEADGIIFATPARNFGAEPRMMELFSWLMTTTDYPEYPLDRKVASFMTVCEEDGGQASNAQMWSPATHLGFIADKSLYFNKFAKESEGNWQVEDQPEVGTSLLELVKATQHLRDPK
jgi:multimeric flavodoxin WrbA